MASNIVEVLIRLRDQMSGQLDRATAKLKQFDKSMLLMGATATAVTTSVAYAFKKCVQAAAEQAKQEEMLAYAMQQKNVYTAEAHAALLEYAKQLQRVTTYGDEQIMMVERMMVQFGIQGDLLRELTRATLDFATAKGLDLAQAGFIVAKSIGSELNALGRYGVEVEGAVGSTERARSALAGLSRLFGGTAAAHARTFAGCMMQLKHAISDFMEALAGWMLPGLTQAIRWIRQHILSIRDWINAHKTVIQIIAAVVAWIVGSYGIVQAIITLKSALIGLKVALTLLGGPIGIISLAIVGATFAFLKFRNEISEGVIKALEFLMVAVHRVVGAINALLTKIGIHWLDGAVDAIDNAIETLKRWDDAIDIAQAKATAGTEITAAGFQHVEDAVEGATNALDDYSDAVRAALNRDIIDLGQELVERLRAQDEAAKQAAERFKAMQEFGIAPKLRTAPAVEAPFEWTPGVTPKPSILQRIDEELANAEVQLGEYFYNMEANAVRASIAIADALGSAVQQTIMHGGSLCDAMKAAFRSMVASAIAEISRLIAKIMILGTLRSLFGLRFAHGGVVPHMQSGGVISWLAPQRGVPIYAHPGEMILNREQQARLFAMLAGRLTTERSAPTIVINTMDTATLEHELRYGRLGDLIVGALM